MAVQEKDLSKISLKNMFENALESYVKINTVHQTSIEQQKSVKNTIEKLEEITRLINVAEVFSNNEMLEEVATENIQYLAVPCMLGALVGRLQTGDRHSNLEVSEIYFKDFLQRGKEYGLVPESLRVNVENVLSQNNDITRQVLDRNEKIRKYEEQKKLEEDLVRLKQNLERADDEDRRNYYMVYVKSLINLASEELASIALEKPLALMRKNNPELSKKQPKRDPPPPLKPVIITRTAMEKTVFGLGYPSIPTMTVDEFYEERVREGIFPSGPSSYGKSMQQMADPEYNARMEEKEEEESEKREEADDPDELARQRSVDDYKDDHRAGWGNRYNRS